MPPRLHAILGALLLSGCLVPQESADPAAPSTMIVVSSPAFAHGATIPREHTCDGDDVSPALNLYNVPPLAQSLVLLVEDPDAPRGTFVHWTAWNLSANTTVLPRAVDVEALGGREGTNDAGERGYTGPCPPSGTHRYFFRVYALASAPLLAAGSPPEDVRALLDKGDVLAQGELLGLYGPRGPPPQGPEKAARGPGGPGGESLES